MVERSSLMERENKIKKIIYTWTVTVYIYTVTVDLHTRVYILHDFTPTDVGVFSAKMCKKACFMYFARVSMDWCGCSYGSNLFVNLFHFLSIFNFFFLLFSLIHTRTRLLYLRASTSVHGYSCKIHKAALFTHFGQKNTHISGCKIVQNIHPPMRMNSNRVDIHGYCSCVNYFFILFSLSIKLLLSTITNAPK